jgi:ion channel
LATSGTATAVLKRASRLERFHATHSYWAVLGAISAGFLFAALAPDASWATSVLVLIQTATLVLALRTAGWRVMESRVVFALVALGSGAAAANLVWSGNDLTAVLGVLTGLLTLALAVVIALGAVEQGEVNSKSVAGAICVYVLLGMLFMYVYGMMAVLGHGSFFAQGTDGTRSLRLYFSYVTLATLGYGDYTPAGNLGHTFAVLEALVGQLYLVTVVAVVVTRISGRGRRR